MYSCPNICFDSIKSAERTYNILCGLLSIATEKTHFRLRDFICWQIWQMGDLFSQRSAVPSMWKSRVGFKLLMKSWKRIFWDDCTYISSLERNNQSNFWFNQYSCVSLCSKMRLWNIFFPVMRVVNLFWEEKNLLMIINSNSCKLKSFDAK